MKKTYQNPTMKVVKIQTAQMMAASLRFGESVTDASVAEGRNGDVWDDEDYE